MSDFAQGQLLAQLTPSGITPVTLFTATMRTEITLLLGPVLTGTPTIQVYHDVNGTTYTNAELILQYSRAVNGDPNLFQAQSRGSGIMLAAGDSIGVETSVANSVNFSLYGITETLAERIRQQSR